MRPPGITIVSLGMVSLVLAGLYSWLPGTDKGLPPEEDVIGPASTRSVPSQAGSTQPGSTRFVTSRPAATAPAAHTAPPPAKSYGAAEVHLNQVAGDLEEAFSTARHDTDPQRRIEALRFLGEHALQEHFGVLQQIQIQESTSEVRRAAEDAIHLLMARFAGQPWPGIPSGEHPFNYMMGETSPGAP